MAIFEKKCVITKGKRKYRCKLFGIKFTIRQIFNFHNPKKLYSYIENSIKKNKNSYIPITTTPYNKNNTTKAIAYYLPQFHSIPLNDEAHGKGFTEWTNVTKAIPIFEGHHQPQIPIDVGFYDLSQDTAMYRQIELAKLYGIYGFCFHYYWFSGKRLLEKPIFNYLENKELSHPFCLCWANENWSKLWDGGNREIIMEQNLKDDDAEKFFYDILPFFKDERYIKIDNKPFLIIYRLGLFEKAKVQQFIKTLRELAIREGFSGLHIGGVICFDFNNDYDYDVDSWIEFPPHKTNIPFAQMDTYVNKNFVGTIFDCRDYVRKNEYTKENNPKLFKSVFPGWDNTARKAISNAAIFICPPESYKIWLKNIIKWTQKNHKEENRYVFINAWNEWGEGAHLEPDTHYGYAYLQATKEALEETGENNG